MLSYVLVIELLYHRSTAEAEMRWLAAALLALRAAQAAAPPVSINLQTSWSAPPILLEILSVHPHLPLPYPTDGQ